MKFDKPLDFELEFSSKQHPFEAFDMLELSLFVNVDRTRQFECLIESKNSPAFANYLFKNFDLSRSSEIAAKSCFLKFI